MCTCLLRLCSTDHVAKCVITVASMDDEASASYNHDMDADDIIDLTNMETGLSSPQRLGCRAPACRRGIGVNAWKKRFGDIPVEGSEYVCQSHWSSLPTAKRKVYARIRRRERRFGARTPASARIWRRLMRMIDDLQISDLTKLKRTGAAHE